MVFYCKFVLQANAFSAREAHAGVPRKQHPCLNFQVSRFLVQVDYFRVVRYSPGNNAHAGRYLRSCIVQDSNMSGSADSNGDAGVGEVGSILLGGLQTRRLYPRSGSAPKLSAGVAHALHK
jgi:hypothetical protein